MTAPDGAGGPDQRLTLASELARLEWKPFVLPPLLVLELAAVVQGAIQASAMSERGWEVGQRFLGDVRVYFADCPAALAWLELRAVMPRAATYLIWSIEHQAWWRSNRRGYTPYVGSAGEYTKAEADAILQRANLVTVNECAIPLVCLLTLEIERTP